MVSVREIDRDLLSVYLLLLPKPWPRAPIPPSEWPAKPPCKNGCGIGGPIIGSWLTFILTGIGRGSGIGANPKPGGDKSAAAISNLTNFLASSSWGPQWTCWANSEKLKTMANTYVTWVDFIFEMCSWFLDFCMRFDCNYTMIKFELWDDVLLFSIVFV